MEGQYMIIEYQIRPTHLSKQESHVPHQFTELKEVEHLGLSKHKADVTNNS